MPSALTMRQRESTERPPQELPAAALPAYRAAAILVVLFLSGGLLFATAARAGAQYTIRDDATGGDCTAVGIWDSASKTCSLTSDVLATRLRPVGSSRTVPRQHAFEIADDGVSLVGGGGSITGLGICLDCAAVAAIGRNRVAIKDLTIGGDFGNAVTGYSFPRGDRQVSIAAKRVSRHRVSVRRRPCAMDFGATRLPY